MNYAYRFGAENEEDIYLKDIYSRKYRNILIIGDSYLAGAGLPSPQTQNYGYLLKEYSGFNIYNYSNGGGGFVAVGTNGTFLNCLEKFNEIDKNEIDIILILGGVNDVYQTIANIPSAIQQCSAYVKANYPNALLYVGMLAQCNRINSVGFNPYNMGILLENYISGSKFCNGYVRGIENVLKNTSFINLDDGVHPTVDGQIAIATALTSFLISGNIDVSFNAIPVLTGIKAITVNVAMYETIHNDIVHIFTASNQNAISLTAEEKNFVFNGNNKLELWKEENGLIYGSNFPNSITANHFNISGFAVSSTGKTTPFTALACYIGKIFTIYPMSISNGNFVTSDIKTLYINNLNGNIPSIYC